MSIKDRLIQIVLFLVLIPVMFILFVLAPIWWLLLGNKYGEIIDTVMEYSVAYDDIVKSKKRKLDYLEALKEEEIINELDAMLSYHIALNETPQEQVNDMCKLMMDKISRSLYNIE